jgi:type VI secretion system protein ImpJ
MKPKQKVAWSEGILMLPQHFQQTDRYHESLLASRLDAIDPLNWGVVSVQIDEHLLSQGSVGLKHFEGVLPDGMALCIADNWTQAKLDPRTVKGHFSPAQPALEVFIAVPQERVGVNNYSTENEPLRFEMVSREVFDAADDDQSTKINLAAPMPVLLFGDESRDAHTALKVAEIVRNDQGELAVSDSYIPPCLQIRASPTIKTNLEKLLGLAVSRHRRLMETRRLVGEGRVEFNAADVTRFLQIHALNGSLPVIHYLIESADLSPRSVFLLLSQLAGQLATFSSDVDMTQPMSFDYHNLRGTFVPLFDRIERLLQTTDTEQYVVCNLKPHRHGHIGELQDPRLPDCRNYLFAVQSSLPRPQVVDEFIHKAKIASYADIDIVTAQAISGVPIKENSSPPPQIPTKPGIVYFDVIVGKDHIYWKHVWQDRNVEVRMPSSFDFEKTKIQLFGILEPRDA